jgi:hypothetical protein
MSANVHGHKRPYSAGSGKGEPTSKFAKTATSGYVKRDKPPYHSATPSFGKTASKKPFVNGGARAPKQDLEQRRKRPITAAGGEVDDEEGNEQEDGDEAMEVDGGEGEVDGPAEKRPRMTKDERAALHAAQPHRTALLPSHPLLHDKLLPLWEKARRADLSKEERKKAVAELWDSVKGRVGEVSRGHKGGRVLQTVCQALVFVTSLITREDRQVWWEGREIGRGYGAATSMAGHDGVKVLQGLAYRYLVMMD